MMLSGIGQLTAGRSSSIRTETEPMTSSNKTSARRTRKPSLRRAEQERHPALSPDRAFVLYLVSENAGATRLMRVPVGGGPPELVLMGQGIKNFSCARDVNLCVVAEDVEGKQILTTLDPLKGKGERLPLSDYPNFTRGIL